MRLHISQLTFEYPRQTFTLSIPELTVESGESLAFIGPSGCGKTTLLRLIAGIHVPQSGQLTLDSISPAQMTDAARREFRITRIGFVFQDFQLIDYLNVEENIRLPFRIHPALQWSADAERNLTKLAEDAGIADKRKRPIDELSIGEKQRVAICRALITHPGMILADEPTGNLDPANKQRVIEMLLEETGRRKSTLIMATHDRDILDKFHHVIDFRNFQSASL